MDFLNESLSKNDLKKYIKEFYNYAKKHLKIDKDPKLTLESNKKNAKDLFGKTGYYNPDRMSIHIFVTDRHPKDVIRSFAHELIHHEQQCLGKNKNLDLVKTKKDPAYATNDPQLREMEREAFEKGSLLFRDWCDMKKVEKSKNIMNENKKIENPYPELFEKKDRVAEKIKTNHENELFKELLKRYTTIPDTKEEK